MTFSPLTTLASIIGALVVAALVGWIRKPRLVVFVPRLFSHSDLSAKGHLAEISVINRGFKTEEAIEVSLRAGLTYAVVGANSSDVSLAGHKLTISRIGAGDDVTTLLLVEGGSFASGDIANCLSKESKGILVSKLEDVPPTGPQRIAMVAALVAVPTIMYAMFLTIDSYFDKERSKVREATQQLSIASDKARENVDKTGKLLESIKTGPTRSIELNDWTIPNAYSTLNGPLYAAFSQGKLKLTIGALSRKKDVLTVPLVVQNDSDSVLKLSYEVNSQRSEGRIPRFDRRISDVLVSPSTTATKSLSVVVPAQGASAADKNIYVELFLSDASGDTLKLTRTVIAP